MNCSPSRYAARLLAFAAALFATAAAQAQLTQFTTGGVEVRAFLATANTTVYAAGYGSGLFRSTDTGASFTRIALPANERYLTSLAGNTSTTMVVGGDEGLLTSTDGVNFTRRLHEPVTAVAMGAGASGIVLAGVPGLGILRSTNSGVSFAPADNGDFTGTDVTAMAAHPSDANTFYVAMKPDGAGNRGGIYKSTDGGQNWTPTSAIGGVPSEKYQVFGLTVDSSGNAFAAMFRLVNGTGGIYKLTGGVGSWVQQGNTFGDVAVHRDANNGTTIWGGGLRLGITQSVGGGSFNYMAPNSGNVPAFFFTSVNAIVSMPGSQTALKALKGGGVYRATAQAGGATAWNKVNFPGADRVLSATGVAGNANALLLGLHAGGVWRCNGTCTNAANFFPPTVISTQGDFSYAAGATAVNAFVSVWELASSPTNANLIYAATGNVGMHYLNDNPGLFRFNGTAWEGISPNQNTGAPYNIVSEPGTITFGPGSFAIYGVTLLKGDDSVVFTSWLTDPGGLRRRVGGTWSNINMLVPGNVTPQIRKVVTASANNARVIALPFDDKPLRSTDFGASFSQTSVFQGGFERLRFYDVAENPTDGNNWVGVANKGVYVSNDAGASWTRIATGFNNQAFSAVGFKPTGRAFVADFSGNRYCSSDKGGNWVSMGAAMRAGVNRIVVVNGQLYYLTDGAGAQREDGTC